MTLNFDLFDLDLGDRHTQDQGELRCQISISNVIIRTQCTDRETDRQTDRQT